MFSSDLQSDSKKMSFNMLLEAEFAQQCADNLPGFRNQFITKYQNIVRYAVSSALKRSSGQRSGRLDLDDLVHDVFMSLFENDGAKLRSFQGINNCSFGTWIRIVAIRQTQNTLRRPNIIDQRPDEFLALTPYQSEKPVDQNMVNKEAVSYIQAAITRFPDMDRLIFRLIFEDDIDYDAAAKICRMKKGALYTRVSRIKEKLRKMLIEDGFL